MKPKQLQAVNARKLTLCQYSGCAKPAEVEVSGLALSKPGWWRMCATHRRVFAAQRPLSPNDRTERLPAKNP